jgi:hypothetical protein
MSFEWRGGQARVRRESVTTTGREYPFDPAGTSKWLRLRNLSAIALEVVRVYFKKEDFDTNSAENYLELRAGDIFREPVEAERIWMKSESGTPNVEITVLHRRG